MFKALVSVRLAALKFWFFGGGRDKSKPSVGKMIGFGLLMLYSLAALGFMFWHYFSVMYEAFCPLGLEWLYRLYKEPKRIKRMSMLPAFLLSTVMQRIKGK